MSAVVLGTWKLLSSSASLITGATQMRKRLRDFLQPGFAELSVRDRRRLVAIQKRVSSLVPLLNLCVLWCRRRGSVLKGVVMSVSETLQEVSEFLDRFQSSRPATVYSSCGFTVAASQLKGPWASASDGGAQYDDRFSDHLDYLIRELDFACQSLNTALSFLQLQTQRGGDQERREGGTEVEIPISPAALLRASSRLQEMLGRGGDVCLCAGVLVVCPLSDWIRRARAKQGGGRCSSSSPKDRTAVEPRWRFAFPDAQVTSLRITQSLFDAEFQICIEPSQQQQHPLSGGPGGAGGGRELSGETGKGFVVFLDDSSSSSAEEEEHLIPHPEEDLNQETTWGELQREREGGGIDMSAEAQWVQQEGAQQQQQQQQQQQSETPSDVVHEGDEEASGLRFHSGDEHLDGGHKFRGQNQLGGWTRSPPVSPVPVAVPEGECVHGDGEGGHHREGGGTFDEWAVPDNTVQNGVSHVQSLSFNIATALDFRIATASQLSLRLLPKTQGQERRKQRVGSDGQKNRGSNERGQRKNLGPNCSSRAEKEGGGEVGEGYTTETDEAPACTDPMIIVWPGPSAFSSRGGRKVSALQRNDVGVFGSRGPEMAEGFDQGEGEELSEQRNGREAGMGGGGESLEKQRRSRGGGVYSSVEGVREGQGGRVAMSDFEIVDERKPPQAGLLQSPRRASCLETWGGDGVGFGGGDGGPNSDGEIRWLYAFVMDSPQLALSCFLQQETISGEEGDGETGEGVRKTPSEAPAADRPGPSSSPHQSPPPDLIDASPCRGSRSLLFGRDGGEGSPLTALDLVYLARLCSLDAHFDSPGGDGGWGLKGGDRGGHERLPPSVSHHSIGRGSGVLGEGEASWRGHQQHRHAGAAPPHVSVDDETLQAALCDIVWTGIPPLSTD
uniref:Uncharacterized protein n=1 Tax=Chromera velia CCMP2878 TaxID=1169474 RepID=A0A0G4HPG3_9ALVE|eukprot:Cvel_29806.t1-p1 / transcript=Cvel_29806.t1 / gene=Cvel_29806 / organism=Chromera_velia_CCMP2878 / gene_product=hypothetical protein / transcript_product=hypothetical protein / location=Cvel_scaffold4148:2151-5375(+) / protein_length=897 / sequence_SO=supercontig / SO=protein_coding / is_pseudo=false